MQLCATHFSDLHREIARRGLSGLIRPEDAQVFAQRWLHGLATREEFDPLVVAALEILQKTKEMFGPDVANLQGCPLCYIDAQVKAGMAPSWIENVSDMMLLVAKTNDLA